MTLNLKKDYSEIIKESFCNNIILGASCILKNFCEMFFHNIFKRIIKFEPENLVIMYADTLQKYVSAACTHSSLKRSERNAMQNGEFMNGEVNVRT